MGEQQQGAQTVRRALIRALLPIVGQSWVMAGERVEVLRSMAMLVRLAHRAVARAEVSQQVVVLLAV